MNVQLVLGLDEIAAEIHRVWGKTKEHQVAAWEGYLETGRLLSQARQRLSADRDYGRWFERQRFGFSLQWAGRLRRLAEQESTVRDLLVESALSTNDPLGVDAMVELLRNDDIARARRALGPPSLNDALVIDRVREGETVVINLRWQVGVAEVLAPQGLYVRIDRRSDWGNPFELPDDGDRDTVIDLFADHYLPFKPSLQGRLPELRGKALGCWCVPERCHGDVLRNALERHDDHD